MCLLSEKSYIGGKSKRYVLLVHVRKHLSVSNNNNMHAVSNGTNVF